MLFNIVYKKNKDALLGCYSHLILVLNEHFLLVFDFFCLYSE